MPEPSAQAKDKGVIGLGVVITLVSLIGAFALGDYAIHAVEATTTGSDPFSKYTDQAATTALTGQSTETIAGSPQKVAVGDLNVFQVVEDAGRNPPPETGRQGVQRIYQ